MAKWVCKVCGYVHEGDTPPEVCPICKVSVDKFEKVKKKKIQNMQVQKQKRI